MCYVRVSSSVSGRLGLVVGLGLVAGLLVGLVAGLDFAHGQQHITRTYRPCVRTVSNTVHIASPRVHIRLLKVFNSN